jgi:hypothetical protein
MRKAPGGCLPGRLMFKPNAQVRARSPHRCRGTRRYPRAQFGGRRRARRRPLGDRGSRLFGTEAERFPASRFAAPIQRRLRRATERGWPVRALRGCADLCGGGSGYVINFHSRGVTYRPDRRPKLGTRAGRRSHSITMWPSEGRQISYRIRKISTPGNALPFAVECRHRAYCCGVDAQRRAVFSVHFSFRLDFTQRCHGPSATRSAAISLGARLDSLLSATGRPLIFPCSMR